MAEDHRGRIVGNPGTSHGGHRPTPRLAQLIVDQSNALYGVTPEKAQGMINDYRNTRDGLAEGAFAESSQLDRLSSENQQEASALNDFIANRPKESEQGNPYPYNAQTVKEDYDNERHGIYKS